MLLAALLVFVCCALLLLIGWNHARGMTVLRADVQLYPGVKGLLRTVFGGLQVKRPALTQTPAHLHLPFTETAVCSLDGTRLHGWLIGAHDASGVAARDWVLTFNWFGGCKSDLLPHIQAFHRLGWNVCAFDLRGHGASAGHETTLGWEEGWDVAAAISHLRCVAAPRRLVLHGISLGAVASLRAFTLADLRADGLILESPFDRLLHTVRHRVATFHLPGLPFGDLLLWCGGLRQGFPARRHNPVAYAPQVPVPALILHGADDPYITCAEASRLAAALAVPARLEFIPGHGHGTAMTSHTAFWNAQVSTFLHALPPRA